MATENTAISKSMRQALHNALAQNNPVGTLTGYYDDKLSIMAIGGFFLNNLGYEYNNFMEHTKGSLCNIIISTPLCPFSIRTFKDVQGINEFYMLTKDGSPILIRVFKQDAVDEYGTPMWVISARVDIAGRNLALVNEFIQSGFWTIDYDTNGNVIDVNWSNEFRQMLGYHSQLDFPNELHEWYDRLHPDDYALIMPLFHQMSRDAYRNTYDIEYRLKLKSGKYEWFRTNVKVLRRLDGTVSHLAGVLINIEREKQALEHETNEIIFKTLANTDALTGLYNSRFMVSMLNEYVEAQQAFAILYLDLNWFKTINDKYGHAVGDKLLQAVGKRLQNAVRTGDTVFRIGGDEFAVIISGQVDKELCEALTCRMKKIISRPFTIDHNEMTIEASCGYAMYPQEETNIDKLRVLADHRMYEDKLRTHPDGDVR